MGWERRGNQTYYYTAERVGGRVGELRPQFDEIVWQDRGVKKEMDRAPQTELYDPDRTFTPGEGGEAEEVADNGGQRPAKPT